jgi:hypothetical protein
MFLLLVDGGLVDDHVVVVLVEDHEVVADRQEEVVADRQESLGKKVEVRFSYPVCVLLAWEANRIVAVSAGRYADYPPCPN